MKIENVIEALNNYIREQRKRHSFDTKVHLVLQKSVLPSSTFKAFKEIIFTLWCVDKDFKYEWFNINHFYKISNDEDLNLAMEAIESKLCYQLFNMIGDKSLYPIIDGRIKRNETN